MLKFQLHILQKMDNQKARDFSWAFQVKDDFKLIASIPRDKGTNVPTNSGIEFTFSHENFENYEENFSIQPKAEGRFEIHKRTLVFVPTKLKGGEIYTVKLKAGVGVEGSDKKLKEDIRSDYER